MNSRILTARVVQQVTSAAAGLVTGLLTARWLGPEGKGLLAIFLLVSTVGSQVATMGLHDAASFLRRRRDFSLLRLTRVFDLTVASWGLLASTAIGVGMYAFGPRFWIYPISPVVAGMTGALVFLKLWGLLSKGLLLAERRFQSVAALDLIDGALPGLIFLTAAVIVHPSALLAASCFLAAGAVVGFGARARISLLDRTAEPQGDAPTADLFRYGGRTYLRQIGQMAMARGDVFIVGHLLGIGAVGLYSVAITLSELLVRIPEAIGWMLMPNAASISDERARAITAKYVRVALLVTAAVAIPYGLSARVLISIALPGFHTSAVLLECLLPGVVLSSVTRILGADLVGRGKAGTVAKITWAIVIVGVGFDVWLIPRFGLIAAAVVASVAQFVGAVLMARAYVNESGLKPRALFVVRQADLANWTALAASAMFWRNSEGRAQG